MKKKDFLWSLLAIMLVGSLSLGLSSCGDDDDDIVPETKVTIKNSSTITLNRFRVVFVNSRFEKITDLDFGTLTPGRSVTADIPTGATEYYLGMYYSGLWFFSPNYDISYKNLNLTDAEIGNWTTSSSASRYPRASSVN